MALRGSLRITPEWAANIICVEGRGVWSVEQMRGHFVQLGGLVADLRSRIGIARVLVDLRQMQPQSVEVADAIRSSTTTIYADDDRVALLLATALQRDHMGSLAKLLNAAMFDDAFAALRWLNRD